MTNYKSIIHKSTIIVLMQIYNYFLIQRQNLLESF